MTNPASHPQPEFIDNRAGNTLEHALVARLEWLADNLKTPAAVSIATGYFNPEGFGRVADALERIGNVRLLLGAEPVTPPARAVRHLGEPRGERYESKRLRDALEQNQAGLLHDRDLLSFTPATHHAIEHLLDFIRSGKMEVRRYEKRFLHGKAYIFQDGQGAVAGSSNFTAAGLVSNLELNLGQYQPAVTGKVEQWFEELWAEAVPYDLAALYEARFAEYDPYLIYLRVLWERYHAELDEERSGDGILHLTRFQTDGLERARRILARYNGVLIADSVGLGKSFLAGELLRQTIERERKRALLIAPAALRDGSWARFKHRFQLGVETISFNELADDRYLGGERPQLQSRPEEYSLVVVDEAHALRNADTKGAAALRRLLQGDPPKQLVLMTATPVNNSLWDLYTLLAYFTGHDAVFAELGVPSLRRRFEQAMKEDPFSLKPDVLFDILDATTVRRTRHFVQRYYPMDRVKIGDEFQTIQFPKPHVRSLGYDMEGTLPGFFAEFADLLAPEHGEPALTMARYAPSRFRRDAKADARELSLVGLIRSGLLKRFESSAHAFANTLERMIAAHDLFLRALDAGILPSSELLGELTEVDNDESWDDLLAEGEQIDAREYDLTKLRAAVRNDRAILLRLMTRARTVDQGNDPKLKLLVESLIKIATESERDGVGEADVRNRRKVLIFSYFADTVEWMVEYLQDAIARDRRLAAFRGRLAAVRGMDSVMGVGRQHAIYGFAPISADAPAGLDDDRFDILVCTDVLAEGLNLQQASRIINYDLPWNPMRLVQRHGRIDRIGSPHSDVWLTCVFPDAALDKMLRLEERIRMKLAQAAAAVGLDAEVIPGVTAVEQNFSDTIEEINKIRSDDASIFERGGEASNAHSGEEYRQELRKAIAEGLEPAIRALPGAAGSGIAMGKERGHFFCVRVDDKVLMRFVPLAADGEVVRDALGCLRRITCAPGTPRVMPEDLREAAYGAWERARADIVREWQWSTDPANLQPRVRPIWREAAAHVRANRPEEMSLEEGDRIVAALEAPRGIREERALRQVFDRESLSGEETTRHVAKFVREYGLQPWKAPEPLPPIDEADVRLVVWMAVESAA
ncbi:MAG TPA: helicase-related protein [Gemmatimonadaceae bacterium]|jgi:hypothetical protein